MPASFITGTHQCPDCGEPQTGSRSFEEHNLEASHRVNPPACKGEVLSDWCAFTCANGHVWARPGYQAVK